MPAHPRHDLAVSKALYAGVVELAREGLDRRAIADALGAHRGSVRTYMTLARRRGDLSTSSCIAPQGPPRRRFTLTFAPEVVDDLCCEADDRGLSPADLITRLLTAIVEDDRFGEILGRR